MKGYYWCAPKILFYYCHHYHYDNWLIFFWILSLQSLWLLLFCYIYKRIFGQINVVHFSSLWSSYNAFFINSYTSFKLYSCLSLSFTRLSVSYQFCLFLLFHIFFNLFFFSIFNLVIFCLFVFLFTIFFKFLLFIPWLKYTTVYIFEKISIASIFILKLLLNMKKFGELKTNYISKTNLGIFLYWGN